jgi:hypothetical protein
LSLGDCIDALFEAADTARSDPTFANATDACLATRVAWGVFFSDWQSAGGCAPKLTERLRAGLSCCEEAVQAVAFEGSATENERDLIDRFTHSIGFRIKMLDLLIAEDSATVVAAVDEENQRRRELQEAQESSETHLSNPGA